MKVRKMYAVGILMLVIAVLAIQSTSVSAQPVFFESTGNYYEYVSGQMTWDAAVVEAETHSHLSVTGHLVTITSAEENEFLNVTFASGEAEFFAWIGGYEPNDDGVWLWGVGPEVGVQFSRSRNKKYSAPACTRSKKRGREGGGRTREPRHLARARRVRGHSLARDIPTLKV